MTCQRGWQLVVLMFLPLFLAACAQTPGKGDDVPSAPPPPKVDNAQSPGDEAACRLDDIEYAVGTPLGDTSGDALARQSGAEQVRVLRPGEVATMDHRPGRLNIHLDDNDVIEELRCG